MDVDTAVDHLKSCENIDGAFGTGPGAESHSGQVFTCVSALAIANRLDLLDSEKLGGWLSERQLPNGGLNGRPEKLEDVCYSWWVLTGMATIRRLHWIDSPKLVAFILKCQVCVCASLEITSLTASQDPIQGGFSDRPGNMTDVFHTCFGVAGLSLLGYPGLAEVDPV